MSATVNLAERFEAFKANIEKSVIKALKESNEGKAIIPVIDHPLYGILLREFAKSLATDEYYIDVVNETIHEDEEEIEAHGIIIMRFPKMTYSQNEELSREENKKGSEYEGIDDISRGELLKKFKSISEPAEDLHKKFGIRGL